MEAGERQPRPAADTSLRRSDTPTGSLLRDRLLLRSLACFLKLAGLFLVGLLRRRGVGDDGDGVLGAEGGPLDGGLCLVGVGTASGGGGSHVGRGLWGRRASSTGGGVVLCADAERDCAKGWQWRWTASGRGAGDGCWSICFIK